MTGEMLVIHMEHLRSIFCNKTEEKEEEAKNQQPQQLIIVIPMQN